VLVLLGGGDNNMNKQAVGLSPPYPWKPQTEEVKDEKHRILLDLSTGEWELLDEDGKAELVDLYYVKNGSLSRAEKDKLRYQKDKEARKKKRNTPENVDALKKKRNTPEEKAKTKQRNHEHYKRRKKQPTTTTTMERLLLC
jgi:hypothetical protein